MTSTARSSHPLTVAADHLTVPLSRNAEDALGNAAQPSPDPTMPRLTRKPAQPDLTPVTRRAWDYATRTGQTATINGRPHIAKLTPTGTYLFVPAVIVPNSYLD